MAFKMLYFLVLTAFITQGQSLSLIELPDLTVTYESNPFFGGSIGISKNWWDTLEMCLVTFPNGESYEGYPNDNIPSPFTFQYVAQPFTSCAIGFRGIGAESSGTYELGSVVLHSGNNSRTLTTRRFHLTVTDRNP